MNWYSVFSVRSVMGVALVMAGLAHAADIKLSETSELQAAGDLTYTFAAGDTFVVDQSFSPTSFKPTCSGDFTMKVVEGGSVASSTTLDFSAVTGALTLSGLGTAEVPLPKPTFAAACEAVLIDCHFVSVVATSTAMATGSETLAPKPTTEGNTVAQVAEDTGTQISAVPLASEAETVPTLTISEASATWNTGSWSSGSAPTSGEAVISATTDATLTIDSAVSLSNLTFKVTDGNTLTVALGTDGSLAVTTATKVTSGKVIAPKGTYKALTVNNGATFLAADSDVSATSVAAGGTVGVFGAGTWGSTSSAAGSVGAETMASRFVLRTGTFLKEGEGTFHVGFYKRPSAENQHIKVAGGTLEFYVHGGTPGPDDHAFQTLTVEKDCTFSAATKWAMKITVAEALRGEGAVTLAQTGYQNTARKLQLDGAADEYTGVMTLTGTALTFGEAFGGTFGGALSISSGTGNRVATMTVARSTGIAIAKDLTVGSGVPVDLSAGGGLSVGGNLSLGSGVAVNLSAGGSLSVGGTLTLGGNNVFTLSESAKVGDVLISLTGEGAQADSATAEKILVSVPGLFVVAQGANYVLAASPELSLTEDSVWSTANWTSGGSALGEAPTSGGAKVMAVADATLTVDQEVSLTSLELAPETEKTLTIAYADVSAALEAGTTTVTSGKVIAQAGSYGTVSVEEDAMLLFKSGASFGNLTSGGTIGVSGAGSWEVAAAKALLFRSGRFRKEGTGEASLTLDATTGTFGDVIEVTGGTFKVYQYNHLDRTCASNISVAKDATFVHAARWGSAITFAGALSGEGAMELWDRTAGDATRTATFIGACADFTGTVTANAVHIELTPSDNRFGGSLVLNSAGAGTPPVRVALGDGLVINGDLSVTPSRAVQLKLSGTAPTAKSLTLEGEVELSLPKALVANGAVLFNLSGETATDETAAKFTGVPEGYVVKAEEQTYVLRKVTLPGVRPSEPGAGDEEAYSTEASNALMAAAEAERIANVSQVLLQTKGAASASEPTVTEVNNVLGCFEGVVEADSNSQTLTIRYEFGVADIAADDSETPWNGKWQVKAKVEGPTGAVFVEGVTVSAYEVNDDGTLKEPALSSTTVSGEVSEVTLGNITLEGLGTHGVRVKVKAEK